METIQHCDNLALWQCGIVAMQIQAKFQVSSEERARPSQTHMEELRELRGLLQTHYGIVAMRHRGISFCSWTAQLAPIRSPIVNNALNH